MTHGYSAFGYDIISTHTRPEPFFVKTRLCMYMKLTLHIVTKKKNKTDVLHVTTHIVNVLLLMFSEPIICRNNIS